MHPGIFANASCHHSSQRDRSPGQLPLISLEPVHFLADELAAGIAVEGATAGNKVTISGFYSEVSNSAS